MRGLDGERPQNERHCVGRTCAAPGRCGPSRSFGIRGLGLQGRSGVRTRSRQVGRLPTPCAWAPAPPAPPAPASGLFASCVSYGTGSCVNRSDRADIFALLWGWGGEEVIQRGEGKCCGHGCGASATWIDMSAWNCRPLEGRTRGPAPGRESASRTAPVASSVAGL